MAVLIAASRIDITKLQERLPWAVPSIEWLNDWAWWMGPIVAGGIWISDRGARSIGRPVVAEQIRTALEGFQKLAFKTTDGDKLHHHRVTLFRWQQWYWRQFLRPAEWRRGRWPWSGWLIPWIRSGHATQKVTSRFLAPDNADQADGVVGQAYNQSGILPVEGLMEIHEGSSNDDIRRYARASWVSEAWVRERIQAGKQPPRSLCAMAIESEGRPWGVVVLDSRDPHGIKNLRGNRAVYAFVAEVLAVILTRS